MHKVVKVEHHPGLTFEQDLAETLDDLMELDAAIVDVLSHNGDAYVVYIPEEEFDEDLMIGPIQRRPIDDID